ncbi:hypothetical protein TNCV_3885641 [Trichonephila clavipes]|nr:hypothetical protein TNCV_3885641 [Trichonephila clavipes]
MENVENAQEYVENGGSKDPKEYVENAQQNNIHLESGRIPPKRSECSGYISTFHWYYCFCILEHFLDWAVP